MEQDSLEALKSLIEEEIYLIPEDRAAILAQITNQITSPAPTREKELEVREEVAPVYASSPESIASPEPQNLEKEEAAEPISIRGKYSKGVLVLHEEAELSAEVMDMLVKMINAVGHSMTEVGLVASEQLEGRSMDELLALNPHIVLKFGRINHPINALPALAYEIFVDQETEFLFADSLTMISEDKNLKKKLWTSLQVLFNISATK
jgi:hypothetical protein